MTPTNGETIRQLELKVAGETFVGVNLDELIERECSCNFSVRARCVDRFIGNTFGDGVQKPVDLLFLGGSLCAI